MSLNSSQMEHEPLRDRLGCYGRFGYGTGWGAAMDGQVHCDACAVRAQCRNALRGRVEEFELSPDRARNRCGKEVYANYYAGYKDRIEFRRCSNCRRQMPDDRRR